MLSWEKLRALKNQKVVFDIELEASRVFSNRV